MKGPGRLFYLVICLLVASAGLPREGKAQAWLETRLNEDATTELQNEQQIAISPTDPNNMVVVWRDFRLGYRQVAWAYTFDGGYSWTEGGLFDEPNYPWQSDPGITADEDGNFYAVILSFTSTSQPNGFYVYESTDGGVSWGSPMEVINGVPGVFEDKELIACDRTGGREEGNLYVAWTRFGATTDILLRRSTDGGLTWSNTIAVSDQSLVQFPIPVVGSGGDVYVAWGNYGANEIRIDRSTDGGLTFGADRTVTGVHAVFATLNGGIDAYGSPQMDTDLTGGPYTGRLYIAFMDRRSGYGDYDIWVTASDDQGVSWSVPVRVNNDIPNNGRDQFLPWLTVDNQGIVSVVFLDRRHDPQNRTYHCYLAQSNDGGAIWSNERVSTVPSDPAYALTAPDRFDIAGAEEGEPRVAASKITSSRSGLLGEYIGVVSWSGFATPIWTDIRNLDQDTYAAYPMIRTGVAASSPATPRALRLRIAPNPARVSRGVDVVVNRPGPHRLDVFDAAGRLVRALPAGSRASSPSLLHWDGTTASGGEAAPGVYFLRVTGEGRDAATRVVLVR